VPGKEKEKDKLIKKKRRLSKSENRWKVSPLRKQIKKSFESTTSEISIILEEKQPDLKIAK